MITYLTTCAVCAAIALLWRMTRRDDHRLSRWIDRQPYFITKPLSCGVCFTFWVSLIVILVARPPLNIGTGFDFAVPAALQPLAELLVTWMNVGLGAVSMLYVFVTFHEVSHYYAHKADSLHEHEDLGAGAAAGAETKELE